MTALDEPVVGLREGLPPGRDGDAAPVAATAAGRAQQPVAAGDRWLLAALLGAAGLVHLVMAPQHLDLSPAEGVGFFVAGWAQLAGAAAVLARPGRALLRLVVVANLVFVAVWVVSRTAGLPLGDHAGHAETVGLVDGATVAFELLAVTVAALLLAGRRPPLPAAGGGAALAPLAALVVATAAIASPGAADHAAGAHGDHAAGPHGAHAAGAHDDDAAAAPADDRGLSLLQNGHAHGAAEPVDLDAATQGTLDDQLALTGTLREAYPTLADAQAVGYWRGGPFFSALGSHWVPPSGLQDNTDGDIDAADMRGAVLIYDGLAPASKLAGFMFLVPGEQEPTGFAGPNDHWHYHEYVCLVARADGVGVDAPFGVDSSDITEERCAGVGGDYIRNTGHMVHVWNVPGYEAGDVFADLNPRITCDDGTYYTIPVDDLGSAESICLSDN